MSILEQVVLRIVLILLFALVIIGFRVIIALLKKGWNALVNPGGRNQPKPQAPVNQPPKPPVTPVQPPKPPVIPVTPKPPVTPVQPPVPPVAPQPQSYRPPVQQKAQEYSGTIPLDPDGAIPFYHSAPAKSGYYLLCVRGPFQGKRVEIGAGGCTIGRNPGCTIQFPPQTPGVSGMHCKLVSEKGQILLIDNNSTYGTYSGFGQRLASGIPRPLQVGEAFFLGNPNGPGFTLNKLSGA